MRKVGYTKELLVLPFDHRNSFQEKLFGIFGTPTPEQTALIASYKTMVFEGFEKAVASGLPLEKMGVLVDEQFGQEVIRRARTAGFTLCVAAEKSGQEEFDFEYGSQFGAHIEKTDPDLVKVLVRYNPENDVASKRRQCEKLHELSQYLLKNDRKFMFELLVPATTKQLERCAGNKDVFDTEMRPALVAKAIEEFQDAEVEADVWKLEGLKRAEDFERIVKSARRGGRDNVGCILLGRGENEAKVREWLKVGASVEGVIGFAVGRTVFWEPLKAFRENRASRDEAVDQIAAKYGDLCHLWLAARRG